MKFLKYMFFVILYTSFINSYAENILKGKVLIIRSNGAEEKKSNVKVDLDKEYGDIDETTTDNNGEFDLNLEKTKLFPGNKIKINVTLDGWKMISPLDGITYIPSNIDDERLLIKLVSNNSKLSLDNLSATFHIDNYYLENKYYVQVIAFSKEQDANNLRNILKNIGFPVRYIKRNKVKPPHDILYKVFTGPYNSRKEAKKARKKISDITNISGAIVVNKI